MAANPSNLYERIAQLSENDLKLVAELVDQLAKRRPDRDMSRTAGMPAADRASAKQLKKMAMREGEHLTLNSTEQPQRH